MYAQRESLVTASQEIEESARKILESRSSFEEEEYKKPPGNAGIITDLHVVAENPDVCSALHESSFWMEGVLDELEARNFNRK